MINDDTLTENWNKFLTNLNETQHNTPFYYAVVCQPQGPTKAEAVMMWNIIRMSDERLMMKWTPDEQAAMSRIQELMRTASEFDPDDNRYLSDHY